MKAIFVFFPVGKWYVFEHQCAGSTTWLNSNLFYTNARIHSGQRRMNIGTQSGIQFTCKAFREIFHNVPIYHYSLIQNTWTRCFEVVGVRYGLCQVGNVNFDLWFWLHDKWLLHLRNTTCKYLFLDLSKHQQLYKVASQLAGDIYEKQLRRMY